MGGAFSGSKKKLGPFIIDLDYSSNIKITKAFLAMVCLLPCTWMCSFYCSLIFAPEVYPNRYFFDHFIQHLFLQNLLKVLNLHGRMWKASLCQPKRQRLAIGFEPTTFRQIQGDFRVLVDISCSVLFHPRIPCHLPLLHATLETR